MVRFLPLHPSHLFGCEFYSADGGSRHVVITNSGTLVFLDSVQSVTITQKICRQLHVYMTFAGIRLMHALICMTDTMHTACYISMFISRSTQRQSCRMGNEHGNVHRICRIFRDCIQSSKLHTADSAGFLYYIHILYNCDKVKCRFNLENLLSFCHGDMYSDAQEEISGVTHK